MSVDDAELALFRIYKSAYIDTALPTEKKVRRSQAETVTIQKIWIACGKFDGARWIGSAQGIMRAAKTALAGSDRPLLWRNAGSIAKFDSAAMTTTAIFS